MTLAEFLILQGQLMSAFGWLVRWWTVALLVGGVMSAVLVFTIITTRETISKI